MALSWRGSGGSTASFLVSIQSGALPSDCSNGINTGLSESYMLTNLDADTTYGVRVCAANAENPPELSAGLAMSVTTLPLCDLVLTGTDIDTTTTILSIPVVPLPNGDGINDFSEFTTVIDMLDEAINTVGDPNADFFRTICLDNIVITNNNTLGLDRILIRQSNIFIYATTSSTVLIENRRTDAVGFGPRLDGHSGITVDRVTNVHLANFEVHTYGDFCGGVRVIGGGSYGHVDNLTIFTEGQSCQGLLGDNGSFDLITNVHSEVRSMGTWTHALRMTADIADGGGGVVGMIANTRLITHGDGCWGINLAHDTHIDGMDNVLIERAATAVADSSAIMVYTDASPGYFVTSNIRNVTICSRGGAGSRWEDNSLGPDTGLLTEDIAGSPAVHNAWAGGAFLGAQTFPFSDLSGVGDQGLAANIVIGGACPP